MIRPQVLRLFAIPMMLLTLLACNLSAGTSLETPQAIITATPVAQGSLQLTSEPNDKEFTSIKQTETKTTNSQPDNNTTTTGDLYYVNGSRPQNQCGVQATITTNIRTSPNLTASIKGQLVGGEWIPIFNQSNGWYQVKLPNTPVHLLWISADPTVLNSGCTCNAGGCTFNAISIIPTPIQDSTLYYTGSPLPAPTDVCYVFTAGDFNVNIRTGKSETSNILGQLLANHWLPVRNFGNGWFSVDKPNTPVDGAYIASGPTQLVSTCHCDEFSCKRGAVQSVCDLSTHPETITKIHTEPSNWSRVVGEIIPETTYRVIAQSSSGWYQLETGGWIPPSYIKSTSYDNCRNLQTITYDAPLFDCELVNSTSEIVAILRDPNGEYFGRFGVGLQLGVIKKEGDWFQVYVPAFENAGWVDGSAMSLLGDCDSY